jgi:hypothetical protein
MPDTTPRAELTALDAASAMVALRPTGCTYSFTYQRTETNPLVTINLIATTKICPAEEITDEYT